MPANATSGIHDLFQTEKKKIRRDFEHSTQTLVGMRTRVEHALDECEDQVDDLVANGTEPTTADELSNLELARLLVRGLLGLKGR